MARDFWVDALSVGVEEFDQAHREQLNGISEIEDVLGQGDRAGATRLLRNLIGHLTTHQAEELALLERVSYPALDDIRAMQASTLSRLNNLTQRIETGGGLQEARRIAMELRMAFVDYLLKGDINFKSYLDMAGLGYR